MCWPADFYRFTSIAVLLSLGIACVNGRMVVLDAMAEGSGRVSYVSLSVPPPHLLNLMPWPDGLLWDGLLDMCIWGFLKMVS